MQKYLVEGLGMTPTTKIYGQTQYTGSGGRKVRVLTVHDGRIVDISGAVAIICGYRRNHRTNHIYMRGSGFSAMDVIAGTLLQLLFPGSDYASRLPFEELGS
jgi:hypothetical protein